VDWNRVSFHLRSRDCLRRGQERGADTKLRPRWTCRSSGGSGASRSAGAGRTQGRPRRSREAINQNTNTEAAHTGGGLCLSYRRGRCTRESVPARMSAGHSSFVSDQFARDQAAGDMETWRASVLMLSLNLLASIFDDTRIDVPGPRGSRAPREPSRCCKGEG
jgi:hypothetical protein